MGVDREPCGQYSMKLVYSCNWKGEPCGKGQNSFGNGRVKTTNVYAFLNMWIMLDGESALCVWAIDAERTMGPWFKFVGLVRQKHDVVVHFFRSEYAYLINNLATSSIGAEDTTIRT